MNLDISHQLAQDIVTEIKEVIHQDINYINKEGIIIASTVKKRIGYFHAGGKKVINTDEYLVVNFDGEYSGALKGINIPIYFKSEITGVIGITGDKKEVEKYGEIMKKMTELLIKDAYAVNLKNKNIENQRMVIEEILAYKAERHENLLNQMKLFSIKENVPRVVIISSFSVEERTIIDQKEVIWNIFTNRIMDESKVLMMWERNYLTMILQTSSFKKIRRLLEEKTQELYTKLGIRAFFGVGTIESEIQNVKASYKKAHTALNSVNVLKNGNINFYDEMDIELLIENIEQTVAADFCTKVLGGLTEGEKKEYSKILSVFENRNGSIIQAATELFIHKNTLQYKINKLKDKTLYDMRKYSDFLTLKMAFLLLERS